jgi:hypothetical protein
MAHKTSQDMQGGAVGLSPVKPPPIAPGGPTMNPLNPQPAAGEWTEPAPMAPPQPTGSVPMPKPAPKPKEYQPPKTGSLKRAEILSILYKHGVGIMKDGACSSAHGKKKKKKTKKAELCERFSLLLKKGSGPAVSKRTELLKRAKKVLVTASGKVPDKTKKQVSKALDKNMPGFKAKANCKAAAVFMTLLNR